ncbi:MAG: hypothetical protein ACRC1Z_22705 [Waterburya sp.]
MVLSLKLEVKPNNYVLVTNLETQEQIEVTFDFIQRVTKSSLLMLAQHKYYEIIIEADKHWNNIKRFKPGLEEKIIKEIELGELRSITNIRSNVRRQVQEETARKQQKWNEIAAYNKAQRQLREQTIVKQQQWINDDVILQSQQSYNRGLIALEYADYCLKYYYPYNFKEGINQNTTLQINLEYLSQEEQEIIILKKEIQVLREKIAELESVNKSFIYEPCL